MRYRAAQTDKGRASERRESSLNEQDDAVIRSLVGLELSCGGGMLGPRVFYSSIVPDKKTPKLLAPQGHEIVTDEIPSGTY